MNGCLAWLAAQGIALPRGDEAIATLFEGHGVLVPAPRRDGRFVPAGLAN